MTINLRILVPEATTNYITNPSFRYVTTGWNAVGATLSRSLDYARFGIASLKVVTNGAALNEGTYFRVSVLQGITSPVTNSVYIRGTGKVRVRLKDSPVGSDYVSDVINLDPDMWKRVQVTGAIYGNPAANDVRLYVETADTLPRAVTFYVDGAQMELKPYATSYCDGDQAGCKWNVENNNSISTRNGDTRSGGRWVDLAGPCRGDDNLYVTILGGLGMSPISRQIQPFALAPGGFNQGYKVNSRTTTWNFYVKQPTDDPNPSLAPLHELRQQLMNIIKPDLTLGDEPFLVEYSDTSGSKPLYASFLYDSGLEGEWDTRNGFLNSFPVRMIAVDPFWYEDNQEVKQLQINVTTPPINASGLWSRSSEGVFTNYGKPGVDPLPSAELINCLAEGADGTIYIGYTLSVAQAGVWKLQNGSFSLIGQSNGLSIQELFVGPDGTLYVQGSFTQIGGIAATGNAKYNPSTGTWSAASPTFPLRAVTAVNGQTYVVGSFSGGGQYRIARWDGSQYRTVGATGGFNDTVYDIVQGKDPNILYVCGKFETENGGGQSLYGVAQVDINTNLISPMGYGFYQPPPFDQEVYTLAVGNDGTVYAGGRFTSSRTPGTNSLLRIAQWDGGNQWKPVGDGLTAENPSSGSVDDNSWVSRLAIGSNGELYACGQFNSSGSIKNISGFAKWYGNTWTPMEIAKNSGVAEILYARNKTIYYGVASVGTAASITPANNTVNNTGSRQVYPLLYIKGQGTLAFIKNLKTNQSLNLNLKIEVGEEVFIDFARGEITSTVRGSLISSILPGSEIRGINLLPGENSFSVLVTNDVNCVAQLRYVPKHWSADAIVNAASL